MSDQRTPFARLADAAMEEYPKDWFDDLAEDHLDMTVDNALRMMLVCAVAQVAEHLETIALRLDDIAAGRHETHVQALAALRDNVGRLSKLAAFRYEGGE
jgi:hypothetical protein